jgi:hypothetical protein
VEGKGSGGGKGGQMTQTLYAHMNKRNFKKKEFNIRWASGVAQVVVCLPSKHEALSSNHSTGKKYLILNNASTKNQE